MSRTIDAVFDGEVFRPSEPVGLKPNTRVKIILESDVDEKQQPKSFLQTARSLNLEGPADWARDIDAYLYGDKSTDDA